VFAQFDFKKSKTKDLKAKDSSGSTKKKHQRRSSHEPPSPTIKEDDDEITLAEAPKRKISQALVELNAKTTITADLQIGDVWGTVTPRARKVSSDGIGSPADKKRKDSELSPFAEDACDDAKAFDFLLEKDVLEDRVVKLANRRRSSLPEAGGSRGVSEPPAKTVEKQKKENPMEASAQVIAAYEKAGIDLSDEIRKLLVEAHLGWVESQFTLGYCFDTGSGGMKPDTEKAIFWYTEAAISGHVTAQNNLGVLLATGHRERIKPNHAEAFNWYKKAAESGHPNAEFHVGLAFLKGDGLEQKDEAVAFRWFKRAAKRGHVLAQANVGSMYMSGQGIGTDYKKAMKWSKRAASQGSVIAAHNIAVMYFKGMGVHADEKMARKFLEEAMTGVNAGAIPRKLSEDTIKAGLALMNM
jgi:TPR repeat protein